MTRSGASRALFVLFACTVGTALAAPPLPPPLPPPRPPPPQPPSPQPPPPQPSLLSVLTSLLLSSAGSDLDQVQCAQAVVQELAPAVTPMNATQPSGALQLTISNIICAGCYSGEHTCPTGVEPDGTKVTFVCRNFDSKLRVRVPVPVCFSTGPPSQRSCLCTAALNECAAWSLCTRHSSCPSPVRWPAPGGWCQRSCQTEPWCTALRSSRPARRLGSLYFRLCGFLPLTPWQRCPGGVEVRP